MAQRILVADDDPALLEMMRLTLAKEGYLVSAARSLQEARDAVRETRFDLVVSDLYLGDGSGLDLVDELRARDSSTAIILVTAQGTVETVAAAASRKIFDYLAKPFPLDQFTDRVRAALRGERAPAQPVAPGPDTMIIGNHPSIVEVYKAVGRVAPLRVPVLLRGETGTGKELVARALHRFGANPDGPFVAINCGAIPEGLLESELFGHRKGAFTGADHDHRGAVESAIGGTLFLDEVGELPPLLQVKLLRFLQEGEIRPLGAASALAAPTRVVTATHRDLRAAVAEGRVREDFLYRLSAYEIELPPLRHRRSDIPLLVEHFRRRLQETLEIGGVAGASTTTIELLSAHPWPGNVRELENLVQRAAIDLGSLADAEAVARLLQRTSWGGVPAAGEVAATPGVGDDLTLEELERAHLAAVLERCGGNRTQAAKILGIERKSLYRKARRLGIELAPGDLDPEAVP